MGVADLRWPDWAYDQVYGIRRSILEAPSSCDLLWSHAVEHAGFPGELDGRIQFHAIVLYCLRVGKPPGRLLTSAVRERRFGRQAWHTSQDVIAAAERIGVSNRKQPAASPNATRPRPRVIQDWSEVDAQIESLSDDAAIELLPDRFFRDLFANAIRNGKRPSQVPTLRHVLRRAMVSRPAAASGRK